MRRSHLYVAAAAVLMVSCRDVKQPAAIDPGITACIPANAVAIAGVDLARVRNSPLLASLVEPFREANYLVFAYTGQDLLAIARGNFTTAPTGGTLVNAHLALGGSPDAVRAARTQRNSRTALLEHAETVARTAPIWMVAAGDAHLPFTGNAANVNRLMRGMEYAALAVTLENGATFDLTAVGRTAEDARHFEETLRATLTLAAATGKVIREDRTVRTTIHVDPEKAAKLLKAVLP